MPRFAKQFLLTSIVVCSMAMAVSRASAQDTTASCESIKTILDERKALVDQLNKASANKKQLDPKFACGVFTKLNANGNSADKWFEQNKAWCQVPDEFVENFKKDQEQVSRLRAQACKVAAQMDNMRKQPQQGANPAWGGGLSGQYQMPKGAIQ